jgi:hypothetical protein
MSEQQPPKYPVDVLQRLSQVVVGPEEDRVTTGVMGLDDCLSDGQADSIPGIPLGCSVLISGMPGGGKSTIASMMLMAGKGEGLYLHGEEKARNVKKRCDRVKKPDARDIWLSPLKTIEQALDDVRDLGGNPDANLERVVLDSVQVTTYGGSRKYDAQYEGVEAMVGQVVSMGGILVLVSHVDKTGNAHAGAAALAHLVDIHLHIKANARTSERFMEVRKNRHGRAGYQVPVNIGPSSISVGVPAPINPTEGLVAARNKLEVARDRAIELLLEGRKLSGYDYDLADLTNNPNQWRAALDLAVKTLARDGKPVISQKVNSRMTHWLEKEEAPKAEEQSGDGALPIELK